MREENDRSGTRLWVHYLLLVNWTEEEHSCRPFSSPQRCSPQTTLRYTQTPSFSHLPSHHTSSSPFPLPFLTLFLLTVILEWPTALIPSPCRVYQWYMTAVSGASQTVMSGSLCVLPACVMMRCGGWWGDGGGCGRQAGIQAGGRQEGRVQAVFPPHHPNLQTPDTVVSVCSAQWPTFIPSQSLLS